MLAEESSGSVQRRNVERQGVKLEDELADKVKGRRLTREQEAIINDKSVSDLLRVVAVGDLEFLQKNLASTCQSIFDYYIVANKKLDNKIKAQIKKGMQTLVNTPTPNAYKAQTAVMLAAKYFSAGERIDAIKLLKGHGADLNAQDADGNTVLHQLCMAPFSRKTLADIYSLGRLGVAIGIANSEYETATTILTAKGRDLESVELVGAAEYTLPPKPAAISHSATLDLIKKFEAERPKEPGAEGCCIVM